MTHLLPRATKDKQNSRQTHNIFINTQHSTHNQQYRTKMLLISESQVRRCLVVEQCIAANRIALGSLRHRRKKQRQEINESSQIPTSTTDVAIVPTRIGIPYMSIPKRNRNMTQIHPPTGASASNCSSSNDIAFHRERGNSKDMTLFKPAGYFPMDKSESQPIMGLKVVSVRANNPSIGKPLVPANVLLLDAETGEVTSMVAATYLTAARTAAGSAIATELCVENLVEHCNSIHDEDERELFEDRILNNLHLVVIGAGLQAELHIQYLHHIPVIRNRLKKITIINRTLQRALSLREKMKGILSVNGDDEQSQLKFEFDCITFDDLNQLEHVIRTANVIVACTNTTKPLFNWDWVPPFCHINGVGSYQSHSEEVCSHFLQNRCSTIVDTFEALQVGDLKRVDESNEKQFLGLLGDVLSGDISLPKLEHVNDDNRSSKREERSCTFFKSVGTAIQDIITAEQVVKNVKEQGIGQSVDMT